MHAPRYPGDWRDSVFSGPHVPWGLVGLSHFRPPDTLKTGGTQPFQAPRYPEYWRDSSLFWPPDTLLTGGTQSFEAPIYPED